MATARHAMQGNCKAYASTPSLRMYEHGNASFYATWIDEGLNVVLRCQAQRAHALTFDRTVLAAFALIKQLRLNRFLSGTQDDSEQEEA